MSERIPDLWLEKLALGELPEDETQALRSQLSAEGDERLAAIEASNAVILLEHPPEQFATALRRKLERLEDDERAPTRSPWLLWAPLAATASLALTWWAMRESPDEATTGDDHGPAVIAQLDPPTPDEPETIFLKGDPQLTIERIEDHRALRMSAEQGVAEGDLLQLSYRAAGMSQGVIISIDGAGVATLHFPATEEANPTLDQGGTIPLSQSYELDDAPGFERFFFVTVAESEPEFGVARVMDAARTLATSDRARAGELELPEAWRQQSTRLTKP